VLRRVLPLRHTPPVVADRAALQTLHRDRVVLRVFAAEALRTRAPPFAVVL
jgi:hypothetical protein